MSPEQRDNCETRSGGSGVYTIDILPETRLSQAHEYANVTASPPSYSDVISGSSVDPPSYAMVVNVSYFIHY